MKSQPPPLESVLETALYVDDIARARAFYEDVLGLRLLLADARLAAFDVGGRSVLLLFLRGGSTMPVVTPGGVIPAHDGAGPLHFGFAIATDDLQQWRRHLESRGVRVSSRVDWSRGGTSLYFDDPDGHVVELITPGVWAIR